MRNQDNTEVRSELAFHYTVGSIMGDGSLRRNGVFLKQTSSSFKNKLDFMERLYYAIIGFTKKKKHNRGHKLFLDCLEI
jgi:hypothetical protein